MPNTYTPHYNLAKPESGTVNWDDEINGNFDIIDTALHTLQTTLTSHVTNTNNPHNTVYYQVGAAPAVHTHPGSSITSPVAQANNADKVDGYDANDFVQKATASTITAQHTFNPPSTGAPFILGTNAQGQLVTGLNADKVDGYDANDFVQKATASTITAQHTFNPPSTGAPFILGTNAQGQLVTGLNADKVDGYDANDFATVAQYSGTLYASDWSGSSAPYSQTVTISGITSNDRPIVDVVMSGTYGTDQQRQEQWAFIYRVVTGTNSITFYATDKPTIDIPFVVIVMR